MGILQILNVFISIMYLVSEEITIVSVLHPSGFTANQTQVKIPHIT